MNAFKRILDSQPLPSEVREDLDTRFTGIQWVIRECAMRPVTRQDKIFDREMAYVLLNLFPSYCKKMYQLMGHV